MCFRIGTSERLKVSEFRTSTNIKTYSPIQFILNNVSALVSKLTRNSLHFEFFSAICLIFFRNPSKWFDLDQKLLKNSFSLFDYTLYEIPFLMSWQRDNKFLAGQKTMCIYQNILVVLSIYILSRKAFECAFFQFAYTKKKQVRETKCLRKSFFSWKFFNIF